jgi:polar amino acid transport system substrate-binding protein
MRPLITLFFFSILIGAMLTAQSTPLANDGMVRAAYLATNPAHAVKDPATGEARGVVIDLVRELGRLHAVKVAPIPLANPQAVIDAVRRGEAEIGFVAYNPERAGPVEFSKPYLLVNQTFIVREDSPVRSSADIDRPGRKLGATRADSIALYLGRTLKQAQLVQLDDSSPDAVYRMLREGTVDAFGANRQRLTDMSRGVAGFRLLRDDLYGVEQTIIVPGGRRDARDAANTFIDDVRKSGFLQKSIEGSGVIGIAMAGEG